MMDEFPVEYDAIVLGTGFPESVVAAAFSRVGNKVLHLDRNDYYSGQWVTLTFDALQKWIIENQTKDSEVIVETVTHEDQVPSLEPGTYSIPVPSSSHEISNVVVKSYFCEKHKEVSNDAELSTVSLDAKERDTEEGHSGTSYLKDDFSFEKSEFLGTPKETKTADLKDSELAEDSRSEKDKKSSAEKQGDENLDVKGSLVEKAKCSDDENQAEEPFKEMQGTEERRSDKGHEGKLMSNGANYQGQTQATVQTEERERKTSININMKFEDLKIFWRQFNIDISPKLLFSRGKLVETLISANISHYAEFKAVSRILTYLQEKVEEVPCSRADVFSSSVISVVEKRMLMKFLTFCLDFEDNRDQYEEYKDKTFAEYLQSRRLTPNLQHFVMHAIAMVKQDTSTEAGLEATQSFLQSLGRYGNTPFIWALYGTGELPQAFCRMCAVFGGLYCLRRGASEIVIDKAAKQCIGIISNNQFLKCKWLVMESSYVPAEMRKDCRQSVSRGVFITSRSLKVSEEEHITFLSVPPLSDRGEPVRVIELGATALACPKGVYVVHLVCRGSSSAKEELEPTARRLFHFPTQGDLHDEKPTVLWSLYFNQCDPNSSCISGIPPNVFVTSLPGVSLGFSDALQQAKGIFEEICPNEEFLPAVPNPEDIILDDFLQDATQNASEQPLGEDSNATRIPVSPGGAASSDTAAAEHPAVSETPDHESPPDSFP